MASTQALRELARQTLDFLRRRKRDYCLTFNRMDPANIAVLEDLAKFCRAYESTYRADARAHAALEGRREVWLRITEHLHLSSEDLYAIRGGAAVLKPLEGEPDD